MEKPYSTSLNYYIPRCWKSISSSLKNYILLIEKPYSTLLKNYIPPHWKTISPSLKNYIPPSLTNYIPLHWKTKFYLIEKLTSVLSIDTTNHELILYYFHKTHIHTSILNLFTNKLIKISCFDDDYKNIELVFLIRSYDVFFNVNKLKFDSFI